MAASFAQWPEAVPTSLEIAERCEVELELNKTLIPTYETPEGESEGEYLRRLATEGMQRRYGAPAPAEALERLDMELEVIGRMGYDAYFLIVWDFVKYAKDNGIAVGPGRGSAAGSIVSYCLNITEVDPIAYGLLFERFLHLERVSMPDIDIDFSVRGRDRVMRYVAGKYGSESVAQIVTFGKMLPRAATRDAARVLGLDYGTGDRLAKLIPEPVMGRSKSFEAYLKEEPELKRAYESEPDARQVIDTARGLEGIVRNASIHAAAVVIADRPLTDIVPLQLAEDRGASVDGQRAYRTVTQYSMKPIEEIGLLKMDFLGLRNLDVIEDCLDILERSTGERIDMSALPLDDPKTYEMMARGDSIGVFQFESEGMRETLRKVRPNEFEDLVALNALYRPGAMAYIDTYARNKRNPEAIEYLDERLRPITEKTYGVLLYQEQLMQIAKTIAGFTGAEADDLRAAIGKKNREAMAGLRDRFFEGAGTTGTRPSMIADLWATNEAAADYSFPRAHAACYALIAYRTAWLKANHPAEYMAALISSVMSTKDKVPFFVASCEEMGIEVLPPDVNECGHTFVTAGNNVRFGLDAVKNVGSSAVDAIIAARDEGGPFSSIWDFCRRVDCRCVNKKATEALIKGGALDSTGATRAGMLAVLEQAQGSGQKTQQDAALGQASIFDLEEPAPAGAAPGGAFGAPDLPVPAIADERAQLNEWERETLGLFLSSHPLKEVRAAMRARVHCTLADLSEKKDNEWVTIGGMITECKKIRTRKGDTMMFATLDDLTDSVEMLVFKADSTANADILEVDQLVIVRGRVEHKEAGEIKFIAQDVEAFEPTPEEVVAAEALAAVEPVAKRVTIDVDPGVPDSFLDELRDICRNNPGDHELLLVVGRRSLLLGETYRVAANGACFAELEQLPGTARRAAA
jgi:DNA polymerase-3 subunit alpha